MPAKNVTNGSKIILNQAEITSPIRNKELKYDRNKARRKCMIKRTMRRVRRTPKNKRFKVVRVIAVGLLTDKGSFKAVPSSSMLRCSSGNL